MVAKFETGSSLRQTLNYNEKKVQKGVAELLTAENYLVNSEHLTFDHKLFRLLNQAALNENVKRNSIHISLNFDPSETLENNKLVDIANTYMDKLGLGEQPYLVYRHYDAGHPHIHIVSVKVMADGRRFDTQNIGRNQSEKARKEIEISFNLVKAEDSNKNDPYKLEPVNAKKVQYGKAETKRAINNVLKSVLDSYKYASLTELNALLILYNITADRGTEDSRMFKGNGLMYRVLDEQGNKIGAPIKASQFFMKPTLSNLEVKFKKNATLKNSLKSRVKNIIDLALLNPKSLTIQQFIEKLQKEGIATVLRQNVSGRIYGITYIDHKNRVVFNGSELGKTYSANAIVERCKLPVLPGATQINKATHTATTTNLETSDRSIADTLLAEEYTGDSIPYDLRKKKKRKRQSPNQ